MSRVTLIARSISACLMSTCCLVRRVAVVTAFAGVCSFAMPSDFASLRFAAAEDKPKADASAVDVNELSKADKDAGFVSMFNGKDFTGWRFTGNGKSDTPEDHPNWSVSDGLIKLSGGGKPHMASEKEYTDFEMKFEWRAVKASYNSGFYVRSGRNLGSNQLNLAKGAEGGFVGGKATGAKAVPELQKPAGEWNEWRVLAVGDKLTFWCNGTEAFAATDFKPEKGYVGLQAEGAPLEFRRFRIREISAPAK